MESRQPRIRGLWLGRLTPLILFVVLTGCVGCDSDSRLRDAPELQEQNAVTPVEELKLEDLEP